MMRGMAECDHVIGQASSGPDYELMEWLLRVSDDELPEPFHGFDFCPECGESVVQFASEIESRVRVVREAEDDAWVLDQPNREAREAEQQRKRDAERILAETPPTDPHKRWAWSIMRESRGKNPFEAFIAARGNDNPIFFGT